MSRSVVLHKNAVRPAFDHVARENGASRGRPVDGREADFFEDVLQVVLGIDRRLLRDYVQLAQSLKGNRAPYHQFRREFHAERLRDFSRVLSPHSLVLALWMEEELKGRFVVEEDRFPLLHSPVLASLAKLKSLGSLFFC